MSYFNRIKDQCNLVHECLRIHPTLVDSLEEAKTALNQFVDVIETDVSEVEAAVRASTDSVKRVSVVPTSAKVRHHGMTKVDASAKGVGDKDDPDWIDGPDSDEDEGEEEDSSSDDGEDDEDETEQRPHHPEIEKALEEWRKLPPGSLEKENVSFPSQLMVRNEQR